MARMSSFERLSIPNIVVTPEEWQIVSGILHAHIPGREVWAFGSRARGDVIPYSDLDLAVAGDGPIASATLSAMRDAFDESNLPFTVDVVDLNDVTPEFLQRIEKNRVVVQPQGKEAP